MYIIAVQEGLLFFVGWLSPLFKFSKKIIHLPMKMEPIRSSETSAIKTQTPGKYPKMNILRKKRSLYINIYPESLKPRQLVITCHVSLCPPPLSQG